MSVSSSPVSILYKDKETIRKEDALECIFENADDEMMHVINLIKSTDILPFIRWADVTDNIHFQDSAGNRVLHWAAALGNMKAVTHLIFLGVDLDRRNYNGASPLHCATVAGHQAVVIQLLRHGADVTSRNNEGQTFFDLLQLMGRKRLVYHYEHLKEILLPVNNSQVDDFVTTLDIDFTHKELIGSLGLLPSNTNGAMSKCFEGHDTDPSSHNANALSTGAGDVVSQQETWRREVELICALEAAERNAVAGACWEEFISILGSLELSIVSKRCLCSPVSDLSKRVAVVLGEKYSGIQSECLLLVGLEGQPKGTEFWVAASHVAHSPVVMQYMERFDSTYKTLSASRGMSDVDLFSANILFEDSEKREPSWETARLSHEGPEWCASSEPSVKSPSEPSKQSHPLGVADGCQIKMLGIPFTSIPDSIQLGSSHTGPVQRQLYMSKTYQQSSVSTSNKTPNLSDTHKYTSSLKQHSISDDSTSDKPLTNDVAFSKNPWESVNDAVGLQKKRALDIGAPSATSNPQNTRTNINDKAQQQPRYFLSNEDQIAYDQFLHHSALERLHLQKAKKDGKR